MPTWAKVILVIVLVGVAAVAAMVGAGVYLWRQHGPQFMAGVEQGMQEGREFGATTDKQGCVDEGAARHRRGAGFADHMKSGIFMRSCLEASRETPGFCEAVPGPFEIMKTVEWRRAQCEKYHLSEEQQCGNLFQQVQQYCHKGR